MMTYRGIQNEMKPREKLLIEGERSVVALGIRILLFVYFFSFFVYMMVQWINNDMFAMVPILISVALALYGAYSVYDWFTSHILVTDRRYILMKRGRIESLDFRDVDKVTMLRRITPISITLRCKDGRFFSFSYMNRKSMKAIRTFQNEIKEGKRPSATKASQGKGNS